jgi:AcrR family transcriptional regulator
MNREQLLEAARKAFAEQGPNVPLEVIASDAHVTRPTLYRHFASREELAAAVYEDNVTRIEAWAAELAERDDAIMLLFDHVLEMQRGDRALAQVLAGAEIAWLKELGDRIVGAFAPLFNRGQQRGIVHPDVELYDVMMSFAMADGAMSDKIEAYGRVRFARVSKALHRALFICGDSEDPKSS